MILQKLNKEKFENLLNQLLYNFNDHTLKFEKYEKNNENIILYYKITDTHTFKDDLTLTLNDTSAKIVRDVGGIAGLYSRNYDVSQILQDFLLKQFPLEYFKILKNGFETQKNKKINTVKSQYKLKIEKLEKIQKQKIAQIEKQFQKQLQTSLNKLQEKDLSK